VLTLHLFYIYALQKQIYTYTHTQTNTIIINQTEKNRLYKETNYDKLKINTPERIQLKKTKSKGKDTF